MDPNQALQPLSQIPAGSATPILWFFFALVFLATLYYAFAELYHWLRYGYMYPLVWIALPVYFVGVVVLLGAMLAGIAAV
jgi:hypothetical protein